MKMFSGAIWNTMKKGKAEDELHRAEGGSFVGQHLYMPDPENSPEGSLEGSEDVQTKGSAEPVSAAKLADSAPFV